MEIETASDKTFRKIILGNGVCSRHKGQQRGAVDLFLTFNGEKEITTKTVVMFKKNKGTKKCFFLRQSSQIVEKKVKKF